MKLFISTAGIKWVFTLPGFPPEHIFSNFNEKWSSENSISSVLFSRPEERKHHISNKVPDTADVGAVRPATAHRFMSTAPWSDAIP